jgi:hypothetical protein
VSPKDRKHALVLAAIVLAGVTWLGIATWVGYLARY